MNFKQKIYFFSQIKTDGDQSMSEVLGGKGANIAEMCKLGLPVPPGFTLSTSLCGDFLKHKKLSISLKNNIKKYIKKTEEIAGSSFGGEKPLLLSVRSGAPVSMPGMMETILNIGLTSQTIPRLIKQSGSERFVYDSYRRLIMMYSDVVLEKSLNLNKSKTPISVKMEKLLSKMKKKYKHKDDASVSAKHWQELISTYLVLVEKDFGVVFPDNPYDQLFGAIAAVFSSWNGKRAVAYRALENIPDSMGTAISVQTMVFGNLGENCGTGVSFTRNPSTGENKLYGEWLQNAQGEDVVAGVRTPHPILSDSGSKNSLETNMPKAYAELSRIRKILEKHFDEMQDIEFTIQDHQFWMLQTRTGKRTGLAEIKIATDMVQARLISKKTALSRVQPNQIYESLLKNIEPTSLIGKKAVGHGLPAGPGASSGKAVFTAEKAEFLGRGGEKVILIREETSPEDIHGMHSSDGILTSRGGLTSHAALVARGWGKSCVVGCQTLQINNNNRSCLVGEAKIKEGDWITLNGSTGEIFCGQLDLFQSPVTSSGPLKELLSWADQVRKLKIRVNAETPEDCEKALNFGAEGVGLCRTEHMFFEETRVHEFRKMILSSTERARTKHLKKLLPFQTKYFYNMLGAMGSMPVTVRLLDPTLHEFINIPKKELGYLALDLKKSRASILARVAFLKESNPMLGHRGCRLGISYPEITKMQAEALLGAAFKLKKEGVDSDIEIMVPLVSDVNEFVNQKNIVLGVYKKLSKKHGLSLKYKIGTMLEVPRACLVAEHIAKEADFFSFGTNDLTQTAFGFSRDDTGAFFESYFKENIFSSDPFEQIDQEGVGQLMKLAVEGGRRAKKSLSVGICGEHGGEPNSIRFCRELGLNYVRCSPFRIPVARLAAAQAEL